MKNKITCIVLMALFIATTTLPITNSLKATTISILGEVLDQHSDWWDDCKFSALSEWQEFVPTMVTHTRIEVLILKWYDDSNNLKLTIEKPLGTVLTFKEIPSSLIPIDINWVSFDFPDVNLVPGDNYYIKLTTPIADKYCWGFSYNGLYPNGTSSIWPADWCFRTYCLENNPPNKPTTPSGQTSGETGTSYRYESYFSDPDGDSIEILFDWGDGTDTGWIGPVVSGTSVGEYHTYTSDGNYQIRTKARDIPNNEESEWSDPLPVSMPKNKVINIQLFLQKLFQRFPFLNKILNQIIL